MKLIDEKGRLFGKINIFDLIVLLAIIIVGAAVGYKLVQRGASQAPVPTKDYIVTFKCSAMPDTFADALKKDNRIYYDVDEFVGAKIVDIREEPAKITVTTADGRLVLAESPNLKDVYVDVEVPDKLSDKDIRIGRYAVAVGIKNFTLKTIYATATDCVILDIREK